ncbi:hypothetical protein AIIMSPlu_062 [Pseudomonas phage AIIMS-Plu-RaNi]|nr:hypothetical protein AIIMSPlu_062 [Pseudomonas phage AIIMS-Plu-RaNi]
MKTQRLSDMIDALNALRAAAGLPPKKIYGTSKMAVQIMINRARRGEFN